MTDIESLVKALRLAWLKRIFSDNESTWNSTCYISYVMLVVFYFLNAIMQWMIFQLTRFSTENS